MTLERTQWFHLMVRRTSGVYESFSLQINTPCGYKLEEGLFSKEKNGFQFPRIFQLNVLLS